MKRKLSFTVYVSVFLALLLVFPCFAELTATATELVPDQAAIDLMEDYLSAINQHSYSDIITYTLPSEQAILTAMYSNNVNRENNVGLFNVNSIFLRKTLIVDASLLSPYTDYSTLSSYESYKVLLLETVLNLKEDTECFQSEETFFAFSIVRENNCDYVFDMVKVDSEFAKSFFENSVSSQSVSTPISSNILLSPLTINVYRAHAYSGESSSIIGQVQTVPFEEYCYITLAGEFGTASNRTEAVRAVALAIKNFAFHQYLYRNSLSSAFHVLDSGSDDGGTGYFLSQYYNPTLEPSAAQRAAVDYIFDYHVLDADGDLFPTAHLRGSSNGGQNSGKLYQLGANSLASEGYSFQEIIHYYFDRVSGTSYYNSEVAIGTVSIHKHTLEYTLRSSTKHRVVCDECNHMQSGSHTWVASAIDGSTYCYYCGYER